MIFYFLPGAGIFGGIKVGYQFVRTLRKLGHPAVVASPGGTAARWFESNVPVVSREEALKQVDTEVTAIFSLPQDYRLLRSSFKNLVFHCQGTDPAINEFLADETLVALSCWRQAHTYMKAQGKEAFDVGISISGAFSYAGEEKAPRRVAYMPRRGANFIEEFFRSAPSAEGVPIDEATEWEVAETLKSSRFFLASSQNEWFGLPALEAMAAGCVVLSAPTLGGEEYLSTGRNSQVGDPQELGSFFSRFVDANDMLDGIALEGMKTAARYSEARVSALVAAVGRTLDWPRGWDPK
mgnify:CR=1 FL=1